jgi:small subunit ribosomal protein S17
MNNRRRITGVVTSNKMEKTAVVEISRAYRHKLYEKVVHSYKRVMAHDELGCEVGDKVRIVESRPISRHKHWVVAEILRRDIAAGEPEFALEEPGLPEAMLDQPEISEATAEEPEMEEPEMPEEKSEDLEVSEEPSGESEGIEDEDVGAEAEE